MQQPLVSILIPAFNASATIARALDSCLNQTYTRYEIIVCDDGSEDRTADIARAYPQVQLLQNLKNEGTAAARNRLLKTATGTYIAWLDADDTMLPARLEMQVAFMLQHPGVDILGTWFSTDIADIPLKKFPTDNATITAYLWWKNCMAQPTVMSKNFYSEEEILYDPDFAVMQDYELWLRLRNQKVFANLPLPLTRYHVASTEVAAEKKRKYEDRRLADRLWAIKWASEEVGLSIQQKELLQQFMASDNVIRPEEIREIRAALNTFEHVFKTGGKETEVMLIHFHRLLMWKRMPFIQKLMNADLLVSLIWFKRLKQLYLIQ